MQCQDMEFVKIHKFVNNMLMEMRFKCPIPDCPQFVDEKTGLVGYPYEKAIEHQKNCDFRKHYCELNCGMKIYKSEIEEHEKVCLEKVIICEKCELPIKIN